jgi:prephenate dehydrogenase
LKVALLGLGLIGGSVGLAAHRAGGIETVGYDLDEDVARQALERGAVRDVVETVEQAVAGANVVVAAAPVGMLPGLVREALAASSADCVVTDVGSTKRALIRELSGERGVDRFVGGHPLAGGEHGGIDHARANLFDGGIWFLTPAHGGAADADSAMASSAERRLRELVVQMGARPVVLDAEAHDALLARMSHLPHVLANVLVDAAAARGDAELELAGDGPSFRDATRVAGASTGIWTDIYLANADLLAMTLDGAIAELEAVRRLLRDGDGDGLAAWNELARERRERSRKRVTAPDN